MAASNTLHIRNHFTFPITVSVRLDGWNCCDEPTPGQMVGYIQPMASVDLAFCRKDGHGCNGRQGEFILSINATMAVALNFDSDGGMAPPAPNGCEAQLAQLDGGTYSLIVYSS